jgi:probable HAF family extracellular repeat protein
MARSVRQRSTFTPRVRLAAGLLVLTAAFSHAQVDRRYHVADAGLPGAFSSAKSLNNHGVVAGVGTISPGLSRAYSRDAQGNVRTFPELDALGFSVQNSCSVSDAGAFALTASGYVGGVFTNRAFIVDGDQIVPVPPLVGYYTDATGINAAGHVTGRSDAPLSSLRAYLFTGSGIVDLGQIEPPFGTNIRATGISNLDHIVGFGDNAAGGLSGFLWNGAMNNLGPLQPAAINASGRICGRIPGDSSHLAFARDPNGVVTTLGTLGGRSSAANGLNAAGDIVGTSQRADGSSAAFLWRGGPLVELNSLLDRAARTAGWQVTSAEAVNDTGQILAFSGFTPILLTPHDDCPADFNLDGGIDGVDIEAFFGAWEAGTALADVNHDGGIDGADAESFFAAWQQGGC